ncbi:helix-turn-helix transcriptional regulator [Svornostia abyssi]|uniref:Helix-turn-helix transcriptional regulator n=1 Tax=Svornostia abyssi TaxID=2898438 RepID=A0ABY5PMK9_9ACTN|nr:helix-turn-helix transcriptional regulator [Parviterribacteraceae bacterium J379]
MRVRDALHRVQAAQSTAGVLQLGLTEVCCTLGFRRAALSRINGQHLILEHVHIAGDPRAASRLHDQVGALRIAIASLPREARATSSGEGILVETAKDADVPHQLAAIIGRGPYVAAPIHQHGGVRWFIHADDRQTGARMTEADRDSLWAFAEGLAYALESRAVLEHQRAQRAKIYDLVMAAERAVLSLSSCGGPANLRAMTGDRGSASAEVRSVLTAREIEVLELMAVGATNRDIAQELVISQGTVKTHAASILRKLGAHTRAEAVSHYLGGSPGRPETAPSASSETAARFSRA